MEDLENERPRGDFDLLNGNCGTQGPTVSAKSCEDQSFE